MRFLLRSILALFVLASSVMAQKPESAAVSQLASTQAAARPPIALEPGASGTVPPEQSGVPAITKAPLYDLI
jgi:hypothetical protein